jgi:hypothetical protein
MFHARHKPLCLTFLLLSACQLRAQQPLSLSVDLRDVLMGEIAYQAGFGPRMKILAVNGQPFARTTLQQAMDAAKTTMTPIDFKVDNTGVISDLHLDYHDGQRHPVLERIPNTLDRIAEILQPMSK